MTETDPLLAAVEALTKPHKTWVMQANEAGIQCKSEVNHDPLLQQLRAAVVGGIGSHAGGASASERLPFDAGALALYEQIEDDITSWYVNETQKPVYLELERTLTQWYLAFDLRRRAGIVGPEDVAATIKHLQRWAHQIEGKFDPPHVRELTVNVIEPVMKAKVRRRVDPDTGESYSEPVLDERGQPVLVQKVHRVTKEPITRLVKRIPATCPNCEARFAWDPETGDKMLALIVEYRDEGETAMDNAAGFCRACEMVWKGTAAMSVLAKSLEAEEASLNGTEATA